MADITQMDFFKGLNQDELDELLSISSRKKLSKGEVLFYEGDEPKYLYMLLDGVAKAYKTDFKSREIFLHQLLPVTFIAELANFEDIPYPATCEFITSGEVLMIDYKKFKSSIMTKPHMSLAIFKSLSKKLRVMAEVLHQEIVLTSDAKIAKFIVENHETFGLLKNVKIALILNITPETLSRTLAKMKKDELVFFGEHNQIVNFNKEKLEQIYK